MFGTATIMGSALLGHPKSAAQALQATTATSTAVTSNFARISELGSSILSDYSDLHLKVSKNMDHISFLNHYRYKLGDPVGALPAKRNGGDFNYRGKRSFRSS